MRILPAPKRLAAVATLVAACRDNGREPLTSAAAVDLLLQAVGDDGEFLFISRAQCLDTIHRAVAAGALRRIVPGGGAAPRRWSLVWPVALGRPDHVPWRVVGREVRAPLRPVFEVLATAPTVEWRTAREIADAVGWCDPGGVARVHDSFRRALRGGAPGVERRRSADGITWMWAVPSGLCGTGPAAGMPRGARRQGLYHELRTAQARHARVAVSWEMLTDASQPDQRAALRALLASAISGARHVGGNRDETRLTRLDGRSGAVWYAGAAEYAAADAELTLYAVANAARDARTRLHADAQADSDLLPSWLGASLWTVGVRAAATLRASAHGPPPASRAPKVARSALVWAFGLPQHPDVAQAAPRTVWLSWRAARMQALLASAGVTRARRVREEAKAAPVWSWNARVLRHLRNAHVDNGMAHGGDDLVEQTDFILWLCAEHGPTALAVAARAARARVGLQRGPAVHRWCAEQWRRGEPWARVARVMSAALCGRWPSSTSDVYEQQ
jgi:hypothetical protein